jgi:hypothetical protein
MLTGEWRLYRSLRKFRATHESVAIDFAIPPAILTSIGLMDAAWTLMRTSSGLEIVGVGSVPKSYSLGLEYFASAMALMVEGISEAMLI